MTEPETPGVRERGVFWAAVGSARLKGEYSIGVVCCNLCGVFVEFPWDLGLCVLISDGWERGSGWRRYA